MSGTRSPSPKAPATEALIVSHGQPSDPQAGEVQLKKLASRIEDHLPGWRIRSATLAAPGALEAELGAMQSVPFLFPMFMADGWFINTALPKRLGGRKVHQLSPFGVLPGLPHQTVKYLKAEARRRNWSWSSCDVMIAAHGSSTGPAAAQCANYFARRIQTLITFKQKVRTGFLAEEPFLKDVARFSSSRTLLLPFLAGVGSHLTDDIPHELEQGGFRGVVLPALGEAGFVPGLVAHSLKTAQQRALSFDPLEKTRLSPDAIAAAALQVQASARSSQQEIRRTVETRPDRGNLPGALARLSRLFKNLPSVAPASRNRWLKLS